jgi:pimeloyl-ACP methyl ester carboxylesterase
MFGKLKQLRYGARMLLSRSGQLDLVDLAGRKTQVRHGGEGPPFVYLHSALGECVWLPFLEAWSKRFEVYAPAHPGFASSEGFDQIDTVEDMAFHYLDLFDALGLEQVNLGGVSLGGWIAVEFATRWPERVRRLWLADAPGLWIDGQPLFDLFRHGRDTAKMREALFHDPHSYQAEMIIKDIEKVSDETLVAAFQSMSVLARLVWERPYNPKLAGRLRRVTCPTLIVWGASDRVVPPAYGDLYRQLLPNSRLHVIPACGHLPMFEQEAEFVKVVGDFCASPDAPEQSGGRTP